MLASSDAGQQPVGELVGDLERKGGQEGVLKCCFPPGGRVQGKTFSVLRAAFICSSIRLLMFFRRGSACLGRLGGRGVRKGADWFVSAFRK